MIYALLASLALGSAPYPAEQVLAAFGETCRDLEDLATTEATARAAGWTSITPEPTSPIGQLVALGVSEGRKLAEAEGGSIGPMRVLRRDVAGEELIAVLSGASRDGTTVNGCRVFDVGETRQITATQAERWTGRPPTQATEDAVVSIASWEPGYAPGHDRFELYFVPADSPAVQLVKVSGITLKADFVGAEN